MASCVTHIHKHSNSEGAHGLFNRLFPSQANWSLVILPSTAAQMREEKINSDARQKPPPQIHDLNPKANL